MRCVVPLKGSFGRENTECAGIAISTHFLSSIFPCLSVFIPRIQHWRANKLIASSWRHLSPSKSALHWRPQYQNQEALHFIKSKWRDKKNKNKKPVAKHQETAITYTPNMVDKDGMRHNDPVLQAKLCTLAHTPSLSDYMSNMDYNDSRTNRVICLWITG